MSRKPWENGVLRVSENKKYLFNGEVPFFWMGDTSWLLLQRASREEAEAYLRNRADKGYNVIKTDFIHTVPQTDHYGNHAVENDTDFTKPITEGEYTYWDHIDFIISKAEELAFIWACFPSGAAASSRTNI